MLRDDDTHAHRLRSILQRKDDFAFAPVATLYSPRTTTWWSAVGARTFWMGMAEMGMELQFREMGFFWGGEEP